MPRKSRIDAPGALQHVIGRGINRQEIFSDKADYKAFLNRLGEISRKKEGHVLNIKYSLPRLKTS
jgi:hypothetical protein